VRADWHHSSPKPDLKEPPIPTDSKNDVNAPVYADRPEGADESSCSLHVSFTLDERWYSMRRLFLTLLVGFMTSASHAGTMYYKTTVDRTVYAVADTGGSPQVVIRASELPAGGTWCMTRHNHLASNGQALLMTQPDLLLVYRAPGGAIVSKPVTAIGSGQSLKLPAYASPALAQDDSFFSFRAGDQSTGRSTIWRLNVSVDEVLAPGYLPPTSFDDPRLQLVIEDWSNGDPNLGENFSHTWSPDGARMAYMDNWLAANRSYFSSVRVKIAVPGDTGTATDVRLFDQAMGSTPAWYRMLQWSPVSDQILNCDDSGSVMAFFADSPGVRSWIAVRIQKVSKSQTVTEGLWGPVWRPDGELIGVAYTKTTQSKSGTVVERYPAVITPAGWPATLLQRSTTGQGDTMVLGWAP
jgi:hypothetical protein